MGYAVPSQIAHGLHMRLYSRAFIFADLEKKNRAVFVSIDSGMGSQIIKLEVIKRLKAKYGDMWVIGRVVSSLLVKVGLVEALINALAIKSWVIIIILYIICKDIYHPSWSNASLDMFPSRCVCGTSRLVPLFSHDIIVPRNPSHC